MSLTVHSTTPNPTRHEAIEGLRLDPLDRDRFSTLAQADRADEAYDATRLELLRWTRQVLDRRLSGAVIACGDVPSVTVGMTGSGELVVRERCPRCQEQWWTQGEERHECAGVEW